jgi:hypothetical protein
VRGTLLRLCPIERGIRVDDELREVGGGGYILFVWYNTLVNPMGEHRIG